MGLTRILRLFISGERMEMPWSPLPARIGRQADAACP
jgi:hypothetical protein